MPSRICAATPHNAHPSSAPHPPITRQYSASWVDLALGVLSSASQEGMILYLYVLFSTSDHERYLRYMHMLVGINPNEIWIHNGVKQNKTHFCCQMPGYRDVTAAPNAQHRRSSPSRGSVLGNIN